MKNGYNIIVIRKECNNKGTTRGMRYSLQCTWMNLVIHK